MPVLGAGALAGVGSIGGALIGASAAKKQAAAAAEAQRQLLARLDAIAVPDVEQQKVYYDMNEYLGQIDPELEKYIAANPSAFENISVDPRLKEIQMGALEQLSQYGQTPFTSAEEASLRQIRRSVAADEQARQNSILQSMAQRGQLGSGAELAARLSSSQAAADRSSSQADALAQMAQQRVLEAIAQSGNLSGQMNQQDFGQQAQVANARDVINQFNTQNQRDVQQRNVGVKNTVTQDAQANRQRIAEANTALRNQQETANKGLLQQQFNNQVAKATGYANTAAPYIQSQMAGAANTAQSYANMGQGIGQTALGIAKLYQTNNNTQDATKQIAEKDER